MTDLLTRLQSDLTQSRRAQDKAQTLLLGTIVSDVKNRHLELQRDLTDDDVIEVLRRGIKRRRESVAMYEKGNRADLALSEGREIEVLERYLPAQATTDDVRAAVRAAIAGGASNVGAVMGKIMPQFKGRADGGAMNAIVREELAKGA
ncbi:MAG: GatB/YqeY domain-containing protein [Gemmatimonadaceae bacterium]